MLSLPREHRKKTKNKPTNTAIPIPYDWYQLVGTVETKKPFEVIELNHHDFFNNPKLLKNELILRKKETNRDAFKLTDIRWLRYTREKTFSSNLPLCTGKQRIKMEPKECYSSTLPILKEKNDDLICLLPYTHFFMISTRT